MKKSVSIFLLALCGTVFAQGVLTYNGNHNYTLVERTNLRRYDNDKYTGLMSREIRSFITCENNRNGDIYYSGDFYVSQDTVRAQKVLFTGIHEAIPSSFIINERGTLTMQVDNGYPSFRSFPSFPRDPVKIGDTWKGDSFRAIDPLNNGIITKIPMTVLYKLLGEEMYKDEPVYRISAEWAMRYGISYWDFGGDKDLKSAQGSHKAVVLVSKRTGAMVFMTDTVDETFVYADGKKVGFKGSILLFTEYPPSTDYDKILPALKRIGAVAAKSGRDDKNGDYSLWREGGGKTKDKTQTNSKKKNVDEKSKKKIDDKLAEDDNEKAKIDDKLAKEENDIPKDESTSVTHDSENQKSKDDYPNVEDAIVKVDDKNPKDESTSVTHDSENRKSKDDYPKVEDAIAKDDNKNPKDENTSVSHESENQKFENDYPKVEDAIAKVDDKNLKDEDTSVTHESENQESEDDYPKIEDAIAKVDDKKPKDEITSATHESENQKPEDDSTKKDEKITKQEETKQKIAEIIPEQKDENDLGENKITVEETDAGIKLSIHDLKFKADSSELLAGESKRLDEIAGILKLVPDSMLLVEGHTADTGYPAGEYMLSKERAFRIANELAKRGVNSDKFICKGSGATKPIADNKTAEGMAKNRRVEITILE